MEGGLEAKISEGGTYFSLSVLVVFSLRIGFGSCATLYAALLSPSLLGSAAFK